jgi:hypothetical protein
VLPDLDHNGNLPPGIHRATAEEVAARFGTGSPEREVETTELIEFVNWAREAGLGRLLVDGSYVTSKQMPNDVDVVILPGASRPEQALEALESAQRWPFIHIQVALKTTWSDGREKISGPIAPRTSVASWRLNYDRQTYARGLPPNS